MCTSWQDESFINMARNIEIKAKIDDISFCLKKAHELSNLPAQEIVQEDTFFNCDNGRLKLRVLSEDHGELIFYNRADQKGPKTSEYHISLTKEPDKLKKVLERSYGIKGMVKKTRLLFLVGRTRIHIDQVENLGDFLEFEVVLSEDEDTASGKQEANKMMEEFNISENQLITHAYMDLLADQQSKNETS